MGVSKLGGCRLVRPPDRTTSNAQTAPELDYSSFYGKTGAISRVGIVGHRKRPYCGRPFRYSRQLSPGQLEHAQQMAGHESPRTTKLYDRTKDEITLSEVERIRSCVGCATGTPLGA